GARSGVREAGSDDRRWRPARQLCVRVDPAARDRGGGVTFVRIDVGLVRRTLVVLAHGDRLDREAATLAEQEQAADGLHGRFFALWSEDLEGRLAANDAAHFAVALELCVARRPSIAACLAEADAA